MMEIRTKGVQQQKQENEMLQGEDIRRFTLDLLRATGALIEVHKDGVVDAILPPSGGQRKMLEHSDGDFLRLAFDRDIASAHSDAQYVALGSPLTDQLIELAED